MKIVLKFQICILYTFREISRQRALRPGRAESGRVGRFIILNDSAGHTSFSMDIFFSHFSVFFKGFRADLMSMNRPMYDCYRNFVRFAHS